MGWTVYNSDGKILQSAELGDNAVTSAKIADGAIVNADVNASAAVAYSKLAALADGNILVGNGSNVATSVNPSGDVDIANDGTFSIASGAVVNADVNASAAIAFSKMENLTSSRLLVSDGNGDVSVSSVTTTNLTDLTDSGATTLHSHAGGGPTEATQAVMEENTPGSSTANTYISPEVAKFHPGVASVWLHHDGNTTTAINASFGISSVNWDSNGVYSISFAADLSSANYVAVATVSEGTSAVNRHAIVTNKGTGGCKNRNFDDANNVANTQGNILIFGEFA